MCNLETQIYTALLEVEMVSVFFFLQKDGNLHYKMHGNNKLRKEQLKPHSYVTNASRPRRVWGVKRKPYSINIYIDLTHIYNQSPEGISEKKKKKEKKKRKEKKKEEKKRKKKET